MMIVIRFGVKDEAIESEYRGYYNTYSANKIRIVTLLSFYPSIIIVWYLVSSSHAPIVAQVAF